MATKLLAALAKPGAAPCASTSLPVPLSPSSSTLALLGATFSIVRQMRSMSGSRVIRPDSASG